MDKLYAISLIAATYFVYGFAAGYEDMGFYSDGFFMENLQHLAQKRLVSNQMSGLPQLLRRLQKNSGADAPTSDVRTTIRISGVSETGEVTLEASLPQTVEFVWWFEYARSRPIVTKGDEGIDGRMKTSSLVLNVNQYEHLTATLMLTADSSMAGFRIELNNNTQATVQSMLFPDPAIDIPDTAQVNANGEITLDVTVPISASNQSKPAAVILYTYTDRTSEEINTVVLENTLLEKNQITMRNVPNAIEGYLTVIIRPDNVSKRDESPLPYMRIFMKYVDVPGTNVSYRNDMVTSVRSFATNSISSNGTIRYGSVACVAIGHPKPVITFLKNSHDISHNNVMVTKFMSCAYVSLDGKNISEAAGTYHCKATSGNETIIDEDLIVG